MSRPVIFVPGLPASHLFDTTGPLPKRIFLNLGGFKNPQLEGPDDLHAEEPIRAGDPVRHALRFLVFDIAKQAGTLYDVLGRFGIDPVKLGWDWRRPVWDDVFVDPQGPFSVQNRLTAAIRDTRQASGQKVVIIAHSTGGLVLRSLLEKSPELVDDVEFVVAFGVPWAGTPKSMEMVNGQEGFAGGLVGAQRAQEITVRSWAGWDLFPPDPSHLLDRHGRPLLLTFRRLANGDRQQVSALTDTDWIHGIPAELQSPARMRAAAAHAHLGQRQPSIELGGRRLRVVNVVGWGTATPVEAELSGTGSSARMIVRRDTQEETLDGGDGTVPRRSADWLRSGPDLEVTTHHVPVGWLPSTRIHVHGRLWSNPGGVNLLQRHLDGRPHEPFAYAALDADDSSQGSTSTRIRVRAVALDADGAPLDQAAIRTRNLQGAQIEQSFDPQFEGRHTLQVPRSRIPAVGNGVRRLELEILWKENEATRRQSRNFLFFG